MARHEGHLTTKLSDPATGTLGKPEPYGKTESKSRVRCIAVFGVTLADRYYRRQTALLSVAACNRNGPDRGLGEAIQAGLAT